MATDDYAVMLPLPSIGIDEVLPNVLAVADDMAREAGAFDGRTRTHEVHRPIELGGEPIPMRLDDGTEVPTPSVLRVLYRRDA